jgi:hypothetical protein
MAIFLLSKRIFSVATKTPTNYFVDSIILALLLHPALDVREHGET